MDDEKLDVKVKFGQIQIGAETARLAFSIDRDSITTETMERFFCGSQLEIKAKAGKDAAEDTEGQTTIEGTDDEPLLEATIDAKTCGLKPASYTSGLTFNVKAVDVSLLAKFASKTGRLVVTRLGDSSGE